MYPARNGDAFLVDAGGPHILVDGGFASTYQDYIATDLALLAAHGGRLNLVICTHIDGDHIGGLLEFFSLNGPSERRGIEVGAVWHNSLRSLPTSTSRPGNVNDRMLLEAIRRRGYQDAAVASANPISARQGSSLGKLLRQYAYSWNSGDGTNCISDGTAPLSVGGNVGLQVIGPKPERLEALRDLWLREVRKLGYSGSLDASDLLDDAYEMWCASAPPPTVPTAVPIAASANLRLADVYTPDTSISNGSSIAFIISAGPTRLLFLGDAWAEDTVAKLKAMQPEAAPLVFDAIKVSHHGSLRNTSVELLSVADSPCFLISSDGSRHGHPDFEVLAEIVDRPAPFERQLFFNYETAATERLRAHASRSGTAFTVRVVDNKWIQVGGVQID
ncbi:AVAST type 1 anti-phage system MBL fold metallo-hydrolase Avs1a [Variovorax ureilyticus]|uniref:AVAST type 1 anti-phage system MBL fold metallo-hydrolase Avs1a n=1 Tax=Variovorax ureilyticus TaxID=1836198 RepID=UPI003D676F72